MYRSRDVVNRIQNKGLFFVLFKKYIAKNK